MAQITTVCFKFELITTLLQCAYSDSINHTDYDLYLTCSDMNYDISIFLQYYAPFTNYKGFVLLETKNLIV